MKETKQHKLTANLGNGLLLLVLLTLALGARTFNMDWDEGNHLHPDERFVTMVTAAIETPESFTQHLDTAASPMNPYNQGYDDFFYGTLPIFMTRYVAEWTDRGCQPEASPLADLFVTAFLGGEANCLPNTYTSYGGIHLVGRFLAALMDVGALFFIYLIARRLYDARIGLLAVGLGALAAFLIQHSHFYVTDNFTAFFAVLTLFFAVRASQTGSWLDFALGGLASGLALACKMSTWPITLTVAAAGALWWSQRAKREPDAEVEDRPVDAPTPAESDDELEKDVPHAMEDGSVTTAVEPQIARERSLATESNVAWRVFLSLCLAGLLFLIAFRIAQPYAFRGPGFFGVIPNPQWLEDMATIQEITYGEVDLPYARQWTDRAPILFQWNSMTVWGLGLPLGLAAWLGWALVGFQLLRGRTKHTILWLWATGFFIYQSVLWFKTMRYELPVYHVFILFAAYLLWQLIDWARDRRWLRATAIGAMVLVCAGTLIWAVAFLNIYTEPHTRIEASRWMFENIPASDGVTIATEHWDDSLPLRIDGYDPFGGMYNHLEMQNYNEDTAQKREQLLNWLDAADYVVLTSNRLYGSIPRLPTRYPMTTEYYRALFAGELGFELAAEFDNPPHIGPFEFPDQEQPFDLMEADYQSQPDRIEVPLPPADEAFSVYDHPRVLIFRKTAGYSRERVASILNEIDVERAMHNLKPIDATAASGLLPFSDEVLQDQREGGTWSEIFNADGLFNRYPALAAVLWWAVVTLIGLAAFPVLFVSLPGLRERGYGLARLLGLLLIAYLTWLSASLRLLPNTRATILRFTALLFVIGGGIAWLNWKHLRRFIRERRTAILTTEAIFAGLYVLWLGVRLVQPDLWHPSMGGEKPMDFAYLNAVMKSTWFPPYNPWFSGTPINYYYFGFVLVGTLIQLVGTVPAIAYNLAVPLLFALTGIGVFSVAYNLFGGHKRGALMAGGAAVGLMLLLGNLGVIALVVRNLIDVGGGPPFPSTIPGYPEAVAAIRGLWRVLFKGAHLPIRVESWYWVPSRLIPYEAGSPINEFPAFTFLYGDLHAHMIALPLTVLVILLCVYWVKGRRPTWSSVLIGALAIGALRPTNTWDYPTYLVLGLVALGVGAWIQARKRTECGNTSGIIKRTAIGMGLIVGLSILFFLPYIRNYASGYGSVELWTQLRTPLGSYLLIHAIALFPIATRAIGEVRRLWRCPVDLRGAPQLGRTIIFIAVAAAIIAALALLIALEVSVALVTLPLAALAGLLILTPWMPSNRRMLWLMVGEAMALSLAVELIVVKGDIGRMNTVFKFYLQVWTLLTIAGGVCLAWIWAHADKWTEAGRTVWALVMILLLASGGLFLPLGIRARAVDRISSETGLTLDGMAFMETSTIQAGPSTSDLQPVDLRSDYEAIRWMQENIDGSPVVLEGLGRREYLWANRVSIYTGLPTVVGWRWHQAQQRALLPAEQVEWRRRDVNDCYNTSDVAYALDILDRYDVRYVYVGEYERAYYALGGLQKFNQMASDGYLRVVYDALDATVYEVLTYTTAER